MAFLENTPVRSEAFPEETPLNEKPRPLKKGESRLNPDRSRSTEILITVTEQGLNQGRPTNIPSLWMIEGKPTEVSQEEAVRLARESGLTFPSFGSIEEAVNAAKERSKAGGIAAGPLAQQAAGLEGITVEGEAAGPLSDVPLGGEPQFTATLEEAEDIAIFPTFEELAQEVYDGLKLAGIEIAQGPIERRFEQSQMAIPESAVTPLTEQEFNLMLALQGRENALKGKEAESILGPVVRDATRFLAAYIPLAAASKQVIPGKLLGPMISGIGADLLIFEPNEPRLSNLIADLNLEHPPFLELAAEYLRSDPDDPEALGRFKQGVEGMLLAGVAEGLIRPIVKGYHAARAIKRRQRAAAVGTEAQAIPKSNREQLAELDVEASKIADDVMLNRFTVKEVKVEGLSVEEAKARILAAQYKVELEKLNAASPVKWTPDDIDAKVAAFERRALSGVKPRVRTEREPGEYIEAIEQNREQIRRLQRLTLQDLKEEIRRVLTGGIVDRSGNVKRELVEKAGAAGHEAMMRLELAQGATTKAEYHFSTARRNIFGGLKRRESENLQTLIMLRRLRAIKSYKPIWKSPIKGKDGTQPTAATLQEDINALRENIGEEQFAKLMARADGYFSEMEAAIDILDDAGILKPDEVIALKRFQYSPLQYLEKVDPKIGQIGKGRQAISVRSSGIQALKTGDEGLLIDDPEFFMAQVLQRAHSRAFKNKANLAALDVARLYPDNGLIRSSKPKKADRRDWVELGVYEKGERKNIYVRKDMIQEWSNNPVGVSWLASVLSGAAFVRPLATGINPEFIISNFPRDSMFVWLAAGDGTLYRTGLFGAAKQLTEDLIEVAGDAWRRDGAFIDFINEGGGMALLTHQGRLARSEMTMITPAGKIERGFNKANRAWASFERFAGHLNEFSEAWVRLAVRNRMLKQIQKEKGSLALTLEDYERATWTARRYLDFSQGGTAIKRTDQVMPYLNAGVQGFRGATRAAMKNPKIFALKVSQLMGVYAAMWYSNRLINPEGWAEVPDHVKDQNLVIMTPLRFTDPIDGVKKSVYFKIPIDHTAHGFKAITDAMLDRAYLGRVPDDFVLRSIRPLAGLVPQDSGIPLLNAITALAANYDMWLDEKIWRGSEFIPESEEIRRTGRDPTSQLAIDVGSLTGLSPERLEVAARAIFPRSPYTDVVGYGYSILTRDLPQDVSEAAAYNFFRNFPFSRRFMGLTHPFHQEMKGIEETAEQTSVFRKDIRDQYDLLVQNFREANEKPSLNRDQQRQIEGWIEATSKEHPELKAELISAYKRTLKLDQIFNRYELETMTGMPSRMWWQRLSGMDSSTRAHQFIDVYQQAYEDSISDDPDRKNDGTRKIRLLTRMMAKVPGFNPKKSQEFGIVLHRLAQERRLRLPQ